MEPSSAIPVVIGVTGHRDLRPEDEPALRALVRTELTRLTELCPHARFVLLDSVAAGADMLCAEEALGLGFGLVCPLPMPAEEYRRDFSQAEAERFDRLIRRADTVFTAPPAEPELPGRDWHYRQAGLFVAAHCHVLLALWDGSAPAEGGCGTAEIVAYKQNGCLLSPETLSDDPGAVIHIGTPRLKNRQQPEIGAKLLEKTPGMLYSILKDTDAYDRDAQSFVPEEAPAPLLPSECFAAHPALDRLRAVYTEADALSLHFQKRYLRLMKLFAAAGMLLVLFFLLYDVGESDLFLPFFGLTAVWYFVAWLISRKHDAHGKYLRYRMLAETARIRLYLTAADAQANTGDMLTWTQKHESAWIKAAMDALTADAPDRADVAPSLIKTYWIDSQLAYHRKAGKRDGGKQRLNERGARTVLLVSAALYVFVLVLELFAGRCMDTPLLQKPLPAFFMQHAGQSFTLRSLIKLLLGLASAASVFLADYYGRLSFGRKAADHEKMMRLYAEASAQLERAPGDSKKLFIALAREEIIENGDWLSYCRENPPSFDP